MAQPLISSTALTTQEKKTYGNRVRGILKRHIADGRGVVVGDFPNLVTQPFRQHGWQTFLSHNGTIMDTYVRQFCGTFEFNEQTDAITFCVNNLKYTTSLTHFGTMLNLPTGGHKFYSTGQHIKGVPNFIDRQELVTTLCLNPSIIGNNIYSKDLKYPHDIRYKILDCNVFCREGNHSEVPASIASLLFCLERNISINLAYFVARRLVGLPSNTKRSLPYGMLLNAIFETIGVPPVIPRRTSNQPIDYNTLVKMKIEVPRQSTKRTREETIEVEDEDEEEELHAGGASGSGGAGGSRGASGSSRVPPSMSDSAFYELPTDEKLNTLHREVKGIKKILQDVLNALTCRKSPPRE
jgi:hypothetical protein